MNEKLSGAWNFVILYHFHLPPGRLSAKPNTSGAGQFFIGGNRYAFLNSCRFLNNRGASNIPKNRAARLIRSAQVGRLRQADVPTMDQRSRCQPLASADAMSSPAAGSPFKAFSTFHAHSFAGVGHCNSHIFAVLHFSDGPRGRFIPDVDAQMAAVAAA